MDITNQQADQYLTKILEIIGYADDKADFVDQFLALCTAQANQKAFSSLPQDKKLLFDDATKTNDASKLAQFLIDNIPMAEYKKTFTETVRSNFEDYIETILPTLDETTKTTLIDFLARNTNPTQSQ